ncbi:hypothetical protein DBR11_10070 [Pedobacter sp. HMWF019]|uniref:vWA domain-containing protein n=1 Tax=Pedobacter sp. HMWF019 TaxID=2056856 RepID=UPI000D3D4AFC|nr:VWA domain-containing protein [Pedobacter sp. HMWF019]PTT00404.1 hypothetical protein DBR11_10070 [Pedobacter sp. HMWF019]
MNFLYPGFLFALTAVAIPVLIHLFNFRKYTKVYFSNVQFLKEVKEQGASREKLRNLLLLFTRILAIVFLVLAFARPYWSSGKKMDPAAQTLVLIYVDNSYSMEAVNKDGSLLDEAKRKVREVVKSYGPNDRFQLLTNDFEGKHQRQVRGEELLQLLDEVKISPVHRGLPQVMNRLDAHRDLNSNRFIYLISDFQESFTGSKAVGFSDPGEQITLVKLQANKMPNIAADSVWFLSAVHKPGDAEKLVVKLRNYTEEPASGIAVKLTIDYTQKAVHNLNIPANGTVNDTIAFRGLGQGWHRGLVSVKDYPVVFDDYLNFTFKVEASRSVLNIKGDPGERHIDALYASDSYFKVTDMPESNIRYSDLGEYDVIVLNGLKSPSSGLSQQLRLYVSQGGTVVVFPDLDGNQTQYSAFLSELSLPRVSGLHAEQLNVSAIDLKHEVFREVFEHIPSSIDLPKVNRYFGFAELQKNVQQNLMTLPPNQLFFAQFGLGAGKIYLCATSINIKDSNLPQHPVFVPLMYKVAFGSAKKQPLYYTIGNNDLLESEQISLGTNQSLRLVADHFEAIPELRQANGKSLIYIADQVRKPGFYELKKADSVMGVYAFNEDRRESDGRYTEDTKLKELFPTQKIELYHSGKDVLTLEGTPKNNRTDLWKLCLVLCAVFLAVEVLLIRFFNNTKNIQKT